MIKKIISFLAHESYLHQIGEWEKQGYNRSAVLRKALDTLGFPDGPLSPQERLARLSNQESWICKALEHRRKMVSTQEDQ